MHVEITAPRLHPSVSYSTELTDGKIGYKIVSYQPRGYKTLLMLNSVEHEIYLAHKC